MAFPELERRRHFLQVINTRLEHCSTNSLDLDPSTCYGIGRDVGLSESATARMMYRLLEEGYFRGYVYHPRPGNAGISYVTVNDLTDKGYRLIGQLPRDSGEALVAILQDMLVETEQDPDLPQAERSRRLGEIRAVLDLVREYGPKVLVEFAFRLLGM